MRLRRAATGLGALIVLAGILIGLPAVLIALGGNPLPTALPDLGQVRDAVMTPDDGRVVLAATKVLGWLVWAAFVLSVLVELPAQLRGVRAPALPALSLPQSTTRGLVAAALALFLTAPAAVTAATPALATPGTAQPLHPVTTAQQEDQAADTDPGALPARAAQAATDSAPVGTTSTTYTVQPGDTLWSIAQAHFGAGGQYPQIVAANPGHLARGADWVTPGTVLEVPAPPAGPQVRDDDTRVEEQVVVETGDTLSELAAEHLDDGTRWSELYEATDDVVQPDGRTLEDPDLIYPGWRITLPSSDSVQEPALVDRARTGSEAGADVGSTAPASLPASSSAEQDAAVEAEEAAAAHARAVASVRSGTGSSTPDSAPERPGSAPETAVDQDPVSQEGPAWLLAGLTGSGLLLGGGVFLALARRRRAQFRHRRPGRSVRAVPEELAPVEKTVHTAGAAAAPTVEDLDATLRRLAAQQVAAGAALPVLAAAQLRDEALVLHLSEPADLQAPWQGSDDRLHWSLPAVAGLDRHGPAEADLPAPWPLLVSIGAGDDGSAWLLNLEDLQVSLSGDPDYAADLARYIAAEVAVNPWSAGVRLDCVGIAEEVAPMNPDRVHVVGPDVIQALHHDAHAVHERLGPVPDTVTARATVAGQDAWPARILMLGPEHADTDLAAGLRGTMEDHPGRTGTAIVLHGDYPGPDTMRLVVSGDGRLSLPESGLDLVAVGLTPDEARGCALLLTQGQDVDDVPMPAAAADAELSWRSFADEAGALRPEHTLDRGQDPTQDLSLAAASTLLPEPDGEYVSAAATTEQDLAELSPPVSQAVASDVLGADPELDEDLAAWWDPETRVPRLWLLGPVSATAHGAPLTDRKAYFTELLAYLVLHPQGATPAQSADAFGLTEAKCRDYIRRTREWLGPINGTGELHLPYAKDAPARQVNGTNVYQVVGALSDIDLFRRLRARGEARGGPEGIEDLRQALRLVTGEPFSQLRRGGWAWLVEGDRIDQHMVCAIVDVAHILAVHDLQGGDLPAARAAVQTALLAAPHEEIPTLDLAAVLTAEGRHSDAAQLLQEQVCDRAEEPDTLPEDLPARTQEVLARRSWMEPRKAG